MSGSLVDGSEKEEAETVTNKLACLPLYISSPFLFSKMENGQFTLSFYVFYFLVYKMENVYPYIFQNGKWPIQLKVSVLFLITLSPFSPFLKWKMANSLSFLISLIFLFS